MVGKGTITMRETRILEFKETITNTFLKTVSAFSNYNGGTILFGVDDNGNVKGLLDVKQACLDIENKINDSISPQPNYTLEIQNNNQTIKLTVKKAKPKPKLSQLKSKKAGLNYGNLHGESTVKIKLTNKTQYPITKVKLSSTLFFDDVLDDCRPKKTKTLTVNLKPGKSKTVKIYFGKYPVSKPTRWTYKILQFWYKQ